MGKPAKQSGILKLYLPDYDTDLDIKQVTSNFQTLEIENENRKNEQNYHLQQIQTLDKENQNRKTEAQGNSDKIGNLLKNAYVIELGRWGISSNFTNAVNTTKGINDALAWASTNGSTKVVLPLGNYLIDENNSIIPPSNMTFDLGGSTLKMNTNGLTGYTIIKLDNQINVEIRNGKIQGDMDTHDYSMPGTHEWGTGINIANSAKNITIDNVEIFDSIGDCITLSCKYNQIATVLPADLESGSIDFITGALVTDADKIRTKTKYYFSDAKFNTRHYFGLYGDSMGALGSDITTGVFGVVFYKSDDTFVSAIQASLFFDEIDIPQAAYARFVFYQSSVPANSKITFQCPDIPKYINILNNELHHSRRQGITLGGAKHVYIEKNDIHDIKGTDPQAGIDIEDGYKINQHIYIDKNEFHNNYGYNVAVVDGRHILITENKFTAVSKYLSLTINDAVEDAIVDDNRFYNSDAYFTGEVKMDNCRFYGCKVEFQGSKDKSAQNTTFHNSKVSFFTTRAYSLALDTCKFYNDKDKKAYPSIGYTFVIDKAPITMSNCIVDGPDPYYLVYVPSPSTIQSGWIFDNVTFVNTHDQALPPGDYTNCKFINQTWANTVGVGDFTFKECTFQLTGGNTALDLVNGAKRVKLLNNIFDCTGLIGNGNAVIRIGNIQKAILSGNIIEAPNITATNFALIETLASFAGDLLLIQDNMITSATACDGIRTSALTITQNAVVKNNTLYKCVLNLRAQDVNKGNDLY